jgi:hypothetical protein
LWGQALGPAFAESVEDVSGRLGGRAGRGCAVMAKQNDRVARKASLANAEREVSSKAPFLAKQISVSRFGDRNKDRFQNHLLHQGRTMTEHVYFSDIRNNFSVYVELHSGLDRLDFSAAVKSNDPEVERLVDVERRYVRGEKLADDEIPSVFYVLKNRNFKNNNPAFYAHGFIVVQEKCADVLRKFDLGESSLVETKILDSDRKTPVHGKFFVLNFGSQKDTLLEEQSLGFSTKPKKEFRSGLGDLNWLHDSKVPNEDRYWLPMKRADDGLKLSRSCLEGVDLWHESRLLDAIFFSARLHDALKAAKMATPFKFFRCSVEIS